MDVFCFDFDGVICDSAPETALTAWRGCRALWPDDGAEFSEALAQAFTRVRPALHTGFEAIPMMRMVETGEPDEAAILARFGELCTALMAREGLGEPRLRELFGGIRDDLIAQDRAEWLRWNRFYEGIGETLAGAIAAHPTVIITTKQARFVTLLLEHHGISLPAERIHGLERGLAKPEILAELMAAPEHAGATFHFIEDRLDTLQHVLKVPALEPVRLYLADWGYNTADQRTWAQAQPRITVVSVADFRTRHGL